MRNRGGGPDRDRKIVHRDRGAGFKGRRDVLEMAAATSGYGLTGAASPVRISDGDFRENAQARE